MININILCAQSSSGVQLTVTPWTVVQQARLSLGWSGQDYWNGLPFLPPGDLCNPGIGCNRISCTQIAKNKYLEMSIEMAHTHTH